MSFLSGTQGYTYIGDTPYKFGKWKLKINVPAIRRNTIFSQFQNLADGTGISNGELTIDGPYDQGNMPLTGGCVYLFHLGFELSSTIELLLTAQIEDLTPDNDVENAPNVDINAISDGPFLINII
jgi:hypothetical protein